MIRVVAKYTMYPGATTKSSFLRLAKKLVDATKEEPGCKEYKLHKDIRKLDVYAFIEIWDSQEALNMHTQTEHYKRIVPILQDYSIKVEVDIYDLEVFG